MERYTPLLTDTLRWQRVIFDSRPGLSPKMIATIQEMNGQFSPPYIVTADTSNSTLSWMSPRNAELTAIRWNPQLALGQDAQLSYNRQSRDAMIVEGTMNAHRLRVRLKREDRQFALKTRGFHWIIEDKDLSNLDLLVY
jgi:hypothetical protein